MNNKQTINPVYFYLNQLKQVHGEHRDSGHLIFTRIRQLDQKWQSGRVPDHCSNCKGPQTRVRDPLGREKTFVGPV